ncbi:TetR/AcrR family transcriptional regulator [Chelativorans sp. YIM 93263]|uniref:TetR/AcrR family transcriptional regulator n=1 Tax=Chelativorans sp. YIM 93263 TaxID=2906648 RepID=UPI0023797409|nr:TetR/AcrR family transcriptional regulator [Chelativorans sp. YIM 93263]
MNIFWRRGFDNTSISDLTDAMGLNPPSIYAAFGSKEQLFLEALDLYSQTNGDGIWDYLESANTAHQAIWMLLRATAENYTRGTSPRGCMIVLSAPQMEGGNATVCEELKERRQQNVSLLQRRLERAIVEREIGRETDCTSVAAYFTCVQHGMSIQARDGASRETLLAIADSAMAGWGALVSPA